MIPFVQTKQGVTAFLSTGPKTVSRDASNFSVAVELLRKDSTMEDEFLESIDIAMAVSRIAVNSDLTLDTNTCIAEYQGKPLDSALSKRLVEMFVKAGSVGIAYLIRFLENLYQNPSYRAVTELYGFLDACDLPITEDGCFLTYKRVRENYTDIHTGTFDNKIGAICKMARNRVNEDRDVTCSEGLHVCSYDYLASFGGARTVICKVNPRDVVAVPSDYNNQKMRVCEYTVVGEVPNDNSQKIESWVDVEDEDEDERDVNVNIRSAVRAAFAAFENEANVDDIDEYEDFTDDISYNLKIEIISDIIDDLELSDFDEAATRDIIENDFDLEGEFSVQSVFEFLRDL